MSASAAASSSTPFAAVASSQSKVAGDGVDKKNKTLPLEILSTCANEKCSKEGKLKFCSCRRVSYCGKDCQKQHWAVHKLYHGIMHLVAPPKSTGLIPVIFDDLKARHQMRQEEFKMKTGVLYSPRAVCKVDSKVDSSKLKGAHLDQKTLDAFNTSPPRLVLRECEHLGLSLIADMTIKENQIIDWMGGEILSTDLPETLRNSLYAAGGLDQTNYASLGVFANDGPPNCELLMGPNGQGLLFSIQTIAKGEEILFHYGSRHAVKDGHYYISPNSYLKVVTFIHASASPLDFIETKQRDGLPIENGMRDYIFSTIPVLMRLLLEKHLPVKDAKRSLEQLRVLKKLREPDEKMEGFDFQLLNLSDELAQTYEELFQLVEKIGKIQDDKINKKLIELSQTLTITSYTSLLRHLNDMPVITLEAIDELNKMYQMQEKLDFLQHGTLRGSYKDMKEPFPDVQIDSLQWQQDYKSLSSDCQVYIREVLRNSIEESSAQQKPKFLALQKLVEEKAEVKVGSLKKSPIAQPSPAMAKLSEASPVAGAAPSPAALLNTPAQPKPRPALTYASSAVLSKSKEG